MGPIELCLLTLVAPQAPQAPADPTPPPVHAAAAIEGAAQHQDPAPLGQDPQGGAPQAAARPSQGADSVEGQRARLSQLEQAAEYADAAELSALALSDDPAVAARAAWILAGSKNAAHLSTLPAIVAQSPHAEVRLQALRGLRLRGDASCTPTALTALADDDRRVRTLAVQVLGKLRRPVSIDPLLQLVRTQSQLPQDGAATDVQAALLTLSDLGASGQLLRMAADIADGQVTDCGEALAYAFQTLSPKLEPKQEATALIAVLDHKEKLVRRYAITRLTVMGDASAIPALEGRLGKEDATLRPLLEVALEQLRGGQQAQGTEVVENSKAAANAFGQRIAALWRSLPRVLQAVLCALPVALLGMLWALRRASRQRLLADDAAAAAALAAPSEDFVDEHGYAFDEEGYEEGYDEAYEDDYLESDDDGEQADYAASFEEGQDGYADEDHDENPSLWQHDDQQAEPQLEDEHAR